MSPLLISIAGGAVATAVCSLLAFNSGKALDKQRSDLFIANLRIEHGKALDEANKVNAELSRKMREQKEQAQDEHTAFQESNRLRERAADAADQRLRDQLRTAARGAGPDRDSIASCREDASTLGVVLGDVLRDYRACVSGAEGEAGSARALLRGWPRAK